MADFSVVFDPMLDKERAEFDNGSGGSGASSYVGGERINIAGGTISFVNSADIVNVTGTSVTLQPDTAYKIYATSQAITLNANPPAAGKWAYDGHLEIFTAGTGYVVTGTNVVLANALEPDSVNNCTVRFHDGIAIIAVEDHVAGYIVVNGATSGTGSLYYGIATSTNDYVAFDASLNGTTIPLGGATAEGEKHVVGNGYTETAITGAVNCGTSKFTVANLGLNNVQITGGTMTLGDAYIPSGSTVAVNGGGLAVEKVSGNGGTIDLGGTNLFYGIGTSASASGCTFSGGGGTSRGGAFYAYGGNYTLTSCTVSGNSASVGGGLAVVYQGASAFLVDCVVSGNTSTNGDIFVGAYAMLSVDGGVVDKITTYNGNTKLSGSVKIGSIQQLTDGPGTVTIASGAIIDLTGNTNATPIAPGGGVTFEQGGATILYGDSAGTPTSSATIAGGTVTMLGNDASIVNTSTDRVLFGTATVTSMTFKGTNTFVVAGDYTLLNCIASQSLGFANSTGAVRLAGTYSAVVQTAVSGVGTLELRDGATVTMTNAAAKLADTVGTVVVGIGCSINGNALASGTYTSCTITTDGTITEA